MARAAPRTRRVTEEEFSDSAIDVAMENEREKTAEDLATVLESIAGITGRDLKILIYRIPKGIGKWEYCTEIQPPFETSELMDVLKDQFGSGDYAMRVMVEGKIKTTRHFSIAGDRKLTRERKDESELLPLLLPLVMDKGKDQAQMFQMMMQSQQASADRQMQMLVTMMQQSQSNMTTMVAALTGNREKPADLIAAFAPLMGKQNGGFGEVIEIVKAVRELSGNGGSGEDSIAELAIKTIGPALPDLAKSLANLRGPRSETVRMLPNEAQPVTHVMNGNPALAPPEGARFPILAAIAPDVLFYFQRGHDPEFAAEGVFEVLQKANVPEAEFAPIVAAFLSSENWLLDLSREGIDLTTNPEWAQQFLNGLIALYRGDDDDTVGGGGSEEDVADHGASGADGKTVDQGSQQGQRADVEA